MGTAEELAYKLCPDTASFAYIRYLGAGTYDTVCDELCAWIRAYSSQYEIHLMGYSMGGRLAYSVLPKVHQYLSEVVLISSGLPLTNPKDRYMKQRFESLAIQQSKDCSAHDFCMWWYTLPIYSGLSSHPDFTTFIHDRETQFNPTLFAFLIQSLSPLNMPIQRLSTETPIPLLTYVFGELDHKYADIANAFKTIIPNIKLQPVAGASHFVILSI